MTDGRFFSQLYCQEMQKAWQHCGNGKIRQGRHPQTNLKSFPKFHENAGHPVGIFLRGWQGAGECNKGNQTKWPAEGANSPTNQSPHLRMITVDLQNTLAGFERRHVRVSSLAFCRQELCWPWFIAVLALFWWESKQNHSLCLSPWWGFSASE